VRCISVALAGFVLFTFAYEESAFLTYLIGQDESAPEMIREMSRLVELYIIIMNGVFKRCGFYLRVARREG